MDNELFEEFKNAREITREKLPIIEGPDDIAFFICLFHSLEINDVQVFAITGKSSFPDKINAVFSMTGFSTVKRLGIIRDADSDPSFEFTSAQNSLLVNGQPKIEKCGDVVPGLNGLEKIGVYVVPQCDKAGAIEDLVWEISHPKLIKIGVLLYFFYVRFLSFFFECFPRDGKYSKAKIQVFMAALKDRPTSIRWSNPEEYMDLSNGKLRNLNNFARTLFC